MRRIITCSAGVAVLAATLVGCGDSDDDTSTPATTGDGPSMVVEAHDNPLSFDEDAYEVEAGDVQVIYRNEGSLAHTLLIRDVEDFKLSVGDEDSGTVTLEPGSYTLYCDVAGHEAAGMHAELTVS